MNSTAKIELASVIKKTGPSTGLLLSEWILIIAAFSPR
jgi:hypothetical protein